MKKISVVSGSYNEAENIKEFVTRVHAVFEKLGRYEFELLVIDNASEDGTQDLLRKLAVERPWLKVIFNARNFGHIRSPYHALLQAHGDAVISIVSDLQDPPELIPQFLEKWEEGFKAVAGIKATSSETPLFFFLRNSYYRLVHAIADVEVIERFTGFGLYDQAIIEILRKLDDPYPYFRGLISEIGYPVARLPYHQPLRKHGITKNNLFTLYDIAMLGITNHSKAPLRLAAFAGFLLSGLSLLAAFGYLLAKLFFWQRFPIGIAPLVISIFFLSSVQLFFIGMLGEYIGAIHTQVLHRPLVVEKERINF